MVIASIPTPIRGALMNTEPTALAAGPMVNSNQPLRPKASAHGSQEMALSPVQIRGA